jgi:hypothetical protein
MDSEWVNRAGILAEAVSVILIAPEILGPERLKGAEQALRQGMESRAVQRVAFLAWGMLAAVVLVVVIELVVDFLPPLGWPNYILIPLFYVAIPSGFVCRYAVLRRHLAQWKEIEQRPERDWAFMLGRLTQTSLDVLNPRRFRRLIRPSWWQWVFWAIGIPLHLLFFVFATAIPASLLAFVQLQQRLLAGENRLRALVFGTGVVLLFGGLAAQFFATF